MHTRKYWLMKSEPDVFSIEDLSKVHREPWDGIRNYQARNFMREMAVGDWILFYHSNAKPPGIAGLAKVSRTVYPDHTQFDPTSKYFDPKSSPDSPRWEMVEVEFVEKFPRYVALETLKATAELGDMIVTQKGSRLSVQPVEPSHFNHILHMANARSSSATK